MSLFFNSDGSIYSCLYKSFQIESSLKMHLYVVAIFSSLYKSISYSLCIWLREARFADCGAKKKASNSFFIMFSILL